MPGRHYGSVEELEEAVVQALKALGGVESKTLGEGTYLLDLAALEREAGGVLEAA